MKISPVQGTPTLPNTQTTGLSPERKAAVLGKLLGNSQESQEVIPQVAPPSEKVIKMATNKTPEGIDAPQEGEAPQETAPEVGISDTDVQTKPTPEAIQQVSPQIAALAKEKRALQVKERELVEQQKAFEEKIKKAEALDALEKRLTGGDALSVLLERGVTYDNLTEQILGRQSQPDISKVQEEILKTVEKRFADKDAAQEQAVFDHMSKNVTKLTSSDDYPFIKAGKAQEEVMKLIERTWKEDGEVLDEVEAIELIESELKERASVYAKLLKEPVATEQAAAEILPKAAPKAPGIKTLTNKDSARPNSTRRQRAIAAMLGQNK